MAGGKTLVVADGEGRNSVYLASSGYDVRATDYSQVAQEKAKALAKEAGVDVEFVLSDIYDAGWSDEANDNVVVIFIQFVPPERMGEIFTALARATRAGGSTDIPLNRSPWAPGDRAILIICTHPTYWQMPFPRCRSQ